MSHSVIQPLFGKNPEFYAMSCTKCDWRETLELNNCEIEVITLDGKAPVVREVSPSCRKDARNAEPAWIRKNCPFPFLTETGSFQKKKT